MAQVGHAALKGPAELTRDTVKLLMSFTTTLAISLLASLESRGMARHLVADRLAVALQLLAHRVALAKDAALETHMAGARRACGQTSLEAANLVIGVMKALATKTRQTLAQMVAVLAIAALHSLLQRVATSATGLLTAATHLAKTGANLLMTRSSLATTHQVLSSAP